MSGFKNTQDDIEWECEMEGDDCAGALEFMRLGDLPNTETLPTYEEAVKASSSGETGDRPEYLPSSDQTLAGPSLDIDTGRDPMVGMGGSLYNGIPAYPSLDMPSVGPGPYLPPVSPPSNAPVSGFDTHSAPSMGWQATDYAVSAPPPSLGMMGVGLPDPLAMPSATMPMSTGLGGVGGVPEYPTAPSFPSFPAIPPYPSIDVASTVPSTTAGVSVKLEQPAQPIPVSHSQVSTMERERETVPRALFPQSDGVPRVVQPRQVLRDPRPVQPMRHQPYHYAQAPYAPVNHPHHQGYSPYSSVSASPSMYHSNRYHPAPVSPGVGAQGMYNNTQQTQGQGQGQGERERRPEMSASMSFALQTTAQGIHSLSRTSWPGLVPPNTNSPDRGGHMINSRPAFMPVPTHPGHRGMANASYNMATAGEVAQSSHSRYTGAHYTADGHYAAGQPQPRQRVALTQSRGVAKAKPSTHSPSAQVTLVICGFYLHYANHWKQGHWVETLRSQGLTFLTKAAIRHFYDNERRKPNIQKIKKNLRRMLTEIYPGDQLIDFTVPSKQASANLDRATPQGASHAWQLFLVDCVSYFRFRQGERDKTGLIRRLTTTSLSATLAQTPNDPIMRGIRGYQHSASEKSLSSVLDRLCHVLDPLLAALPKVISADTELMLSDTKQRERLDNAFIKPPPGPVRRGRRMPQPIQPRVSKGQGKTPTTTRPTRPTRPSRHTGTGADMGGVGPTISTPFRRMPQDDLDEDELRNSVKRSIGPSMAYTAPPSFGYANVQSAEPELDLDMDLCEGLGARQREYVEDDDDVYISEDDLDTQC
ncbi:hypothetical protein KIPB_004495 [Kipferlia bialata]|uniref:Uncharacterized protein n=1 Tax=Kipferlia bialata TaxID=797122 RepID=A0A9K3CTV0_9EUKA|nr:hypothetical protein KIPB_004495 [Kipferlia bialata]|eukprot:g4495.t1